MAESEALFTIAELAVALAGFSGVVVGLRGSQSRALAPQDLPPDLVVAGDGGGLATPVHEDHGRGPLVLRETPGEVAQCRSVAGLEVGAEAGGAGGVLVDVEHVRPELHPLAGIGVVELLRRAARAAVIAAADELEYREEEARRQRPSGASRGGGEEPRNRPYFPVYSPGGALRALV